MTFDPNATLDPGQISDRRGMGGRGGLAVGGGGIGLVLVIAYMLLGGNPNDLGYLTDPGAVTGPESTRSLRTARPAPTPTPARTAGSSATSTACRRTGRREFAAAGQQYEPVDTVFHRRDIRPAAARRAPRRTVLLPGRQVVYIDLGFFDELRRSSARRAARSPRPTSSPTSTATTSRTCSASSRRGRRSRRRGRVGADRAPGRLLRRRLGEQRRARPASSSR